MLAVGASLLQGQGAPVGTAINYQGLLRDGGNNASGVYDLTFTLYDAESAGSQIGAPASLSGIRVTNGVFTATLDFGTNFSGSARWLAISVRTNGAGGYTSLSPRQVVTPAPYALYAPSAGAANSATTANNALTANTATLANTATIANSVANNSVVSASIASGQVVKSMNALHDDAVLAAGANVSLATNAQTITFSSTTDWHVAGNAGTSPGTSFLGTTDNQPLEMRVNNRRALRLEGSGNGYGFAAGNRAIATNQGTFVWADSSPFDFEPRSMSSGGFANSFNVRATGGVYFVTAIDGLGYELNGPICTAGSGSFSASSDRNIKDDFQDVDTGDILARVAALPMQTWHYKAQDSSVRHLGPVAQDFRTSFGLGEDDRHISAVDADGVALAAIQGLNQKVEEQNASLRRQIASKESEIEALRKDLSRLGQALVRFSGQIDDEKQSP